MRGIKIGIGTVVALMAAPAWGQPADDWTDCTTDTASWALASDRVVSGLRKRCFEFDEGFSTGTTSFVVPSATASVCVELDVNSGTTGDARLSLFACPTSLTATANVCTTLVKAFTTDDCQAVTRGEYFIDVTTSAAGGGGEDVIIAVQGY
jgi:hypothetical protein